MTLLYTVVDIHITLGVLLYGSSLLVIVRTNYVKALFIHSGLRALDMWSLIAKLDEKAVNMDCEIAQ
jgi:hypothetical protein